MSKKVLEMKNITKTFPGVKALDNVTFDAEEGEILALCGENGAGKSTLMKILSGSYPNSSYEGNIIVNGKKQVFKTPRDSEKAGIAMIYQEVNMHLELSVAENFYMGHWPVTKFNKIDWKKINKDVGQYLALVGLEVKPKEILRNLSTSQHQLLSIARALSKNPRILVLDEPTSALTETESVKLFKILHDLKAKEITSILISHKLDEVFENSDRITVLRDGKSIGTHGKNETTNEQIICEMVGREISSLYPKEVIPLGDMAIEVKNITVPHPFNPSKNIVENISFYVNKSEILGIAGLVGSGRSELVNSIFGLLAKTSGEIYIDNEKVEINNPIDAIKNGMALVTEDRKVDGFVGVLSIKDNSTLAYLNEISKRGIIDKKEEKEVANYYFEKLGIKAPSMDAYAETLSGGNQQKVVLAKWLMRKPKILILDEPTRGIDIGAKAEIYKIMTELAKEGVAIIMISSELPELISMSDRVIVLSEGKIKGELDAFKCSQEDVMSCATGIEL